MRAQTIVNSNKNSCFFISQFTLFTCICKIKNRVFVTIQYFEKCFTKSQQTIRNQLYEEIFLGFKILFTYFP